MGLKITWVDLPQDPSLHSTWALIGMFVMIDYLILHQFVGLMYLFFYLVTTCESVPL